MQRNWSKPLFLILFLLLLVGGIYSYLGVPSYFVMSTAIAQDITSEQAQEIMKNDPTLGIIDIRTPGEFAGGHLPNAVNIVWGSSDFEALLKEHMEGAPEKNWLYYCRSGRRSSAAQKTFENIFLPLQKQHNTHLYHLKQGISSWKGTLQ